MKEKVTRKRHSLEFKKAAIAKAKQSGNVSAVARDLGLHVSLLSNWVRSELKAKNKGMTLEEAKAEQEEIQRLKRENSRLKEENEILKNNQRRARLPWSTRNSCRATFHLPEKRGRLLIGDLFPLKNVVQGLLRA